MADGLYVLAAVVGFALCVLVVQGVDTRTRR
jgi:hypothetical protein